MLELRTLNHRFVDVRVRLPAELADQASVLEQLVREKLDRGRIDVMVRLGGAALPPARFSAERARTLHAALIALRDEVAPGSDVPLSTLADFRRVTTPPEINRTDRQRSVNLQFTTPRGVALEAAMKEIDGMLTQARATGVIPTDVSSQFQG